MHSYEPFQYKRHSPKEYGPLVELAKAARDATPSAAPRNSASRPQTGESLSGLKVPTKLQVAMGAIWSDISFAIRSVVPLAIPTHLRLIYQEMLHDQKEYLARDSLELNKFALLNFRSDLTLVCYLLVGFIVSKLPQAVAVGIGMVATNLASGLYELLRWRNAKKGT